MNLRLSANTNLILHAFLGGIAWTIHFMLIYAVSEFGCISQQAWVNWSIVALTVVMFGLALYATIYSYRLQRFYSDAGGPQTYIHLSRYGWISNAVFAFIILYQSLPVFYFKGNCL